MCVRVLEVEARVPAMQMALGGSHILQHTCLQVRTCKQQLLYTFFCFLFVHGKMQYIDANSEAVSISATDAIPNPTYPYV